MKPITEVTLDLAAKAACEALGLVYRQVPTDGRFHSLYREDRKSRKQGSLKYFTEGGGGLAYSFEIGEALPFFVREEPGLSDAAKRAFASARRKRLEEERRAREAQYAAVAEKARRIFERCRPAAADHPYLIRKGIAPHGLRQFLNVLVAPVLDFEGAISTLQLIDGDGGKRFLKGGRAGGGYYVIGETDGAETVVIAEGFATAASVHAAMGLPVIVAFNADNLKEVAATWRTKMLGAEIVIAADDDWKTIKPVKNPGLTKAREAAKTTEGRVVVPNFVGVDRPERATDFNDLCVLSGPDAVRLCFEVAPETEPEPTLEAEVERLAHLMRSAYAVAKKGVASRFGITVVDLDAAVRELRGKLKTAQTQAKKIRARLAAESGADNRYSARPDGLYFTYPTRNGDEAETRLTNFTARIAADTIRDDGVETSHVFEIEANLAGRQFRFPVAAAQFGGMNWVAPNLGAGAYCEAGAATKDRARVAIQRLSEDIVERRVYTHLGWREFDVGWAYLHAGGAIGADGVIPDIEVSLHGGLADYKLPPPPQGAALVEAVRASLRLLDLAKDRITFPSLATVYRAPLGPSDFTTWLAGETGSLKSELTALMQGHWGSEFHGKRLPGGWVSTDNSLEEGQFLAKDAIYTIDDFKPEGTSADVARMHAKAARVLRSQGNNSGRNRLRADGTLKPGRPPRGTTLSSGEDTPHGHSVRARIFCVEIEKGDIAPAKLSEMQKLQRGGVFASAMAGYLRWLAPQYEEITADYRLAIGSLRDGAAWDGHLRTADIVRALIVSWLIFLDFAEEIGAIDAVQHGELRERAEKAFATVAAEQRDLQVTADPVDRTRELLRSAIAAGEAHMANPDGQPPLLARSWGWRERSPGSLSNGNDHEGKPYIEQLPCGTRIGWVEGDALYFDSAAMHRVAEKMAAAQGQSLGLTEATLIRRLSERGFLTTETRGGQKRLKPRRTIQGRRVAVLHTASTFIFPEDLSDDCPMFEKVAQVAQSDESSKNSEENQGAEMGHSAKNGGPIPKKSGPAPEESGPLEAHHINGAVCSLS